MAKPKLSAHQRAALPTAQKPFFFYKTAAHSLSATDCGIVTAALQNYVQEHDLDVGEIQVISPRRLAEQASAPALLPAVERLCAQLGFPADQVDIVYCEWAPVHSDLSFEGRVFVSTVLNTGPSSYYLQVFRSVKPKGYDATRGLDLQVESRLLSAGDTFVLDPVMPHMAAPAFPCDNAFLVLLQWEQVCEDPPARAALLERFPRLDQDRNQTSMLDL